MLPAWSVGLELQLPYLMKSEGHLSKSPCSSLAPSNIYSWKILNEFCSYSLNTSTLFPRKFSPVSEGLASGLSVRWCDFRQPAFKNKQKLVVNLWADGSGLCSVRLPSPLLPMFAWQ